MVRRIDALLCSRSNARTNIKMLQAECKAQGASAKQQVNNGIDEMVEYLMGRKKQLLADVEAMVEFKVKTLEKQLQSIDAGTADPYPPENPQEPIDADRFLLCTDSVVKFKTHDKGLKEKIRVFGVIDDSSTYASQSYACGPVIDDALKIGNPSWLMVYTCDRTGQLRKEGRDVVSLSLSSPEHFEMTTVEDLKDGRYRISIIPKVEGNYTLNVKIGSGPNTESIKDMPLPILVLPPKDYTKIGTDTLGEAGDPWLPDAVGHLRGPRGIHFDPTGRYVFVSDQCNDRLQVFDTSLRRAVCAIGKQGAGKSDLNSPGSVVVNRDCVVVVADVQNHRLQIFLFNPQAASLWHMRSVGCRGSEEGQFMFPQGLGLTEDGKLLVCDSGNHRVQVFDMMDDFNFVFQFGQRGDHDGLFSEPLDAAVNRAGEILVSDSNHRIQVFNSKGVWLRTFGKMGGRNGSFRHPTSLVVDDENALFVCDQGNRRIQVFDAADGKWLHKWGGWRRKKNGDDADPESPSPGASPEPPGDESEWVGLKSPADIAVNSRGMILVADYKRHFIYDY